MQENTMFWRGPHVGGTKDYDLFMLWSDTLNRGVLIQAWGRVGVEGQRKIEFFSSPFALDAACKKVYSARIKKDYDLQPLSAPQALNNSRLMYALDEDAQVREIWDALDLVSSFSGSTNKATLPHASDFSMEEMVKRYAGNSRFGAFS